MLVPFRGVQMTRTVDQARLWPMASDEWMIGNRVRKIHSVYTDGFDIFVMFTSGSGYTLRDFRIVYADATPVRVFEGEG